MAMMVLVLLGAGRMDSLQRIGCFRWPSSAGISSVHSNWDPVNGDFGALPFIFGTFVSSFLGLLIALPLSLATAVYLTELAPGWVRQPAISMIEMLAAIPSVVFGLWGMWVLVPWLQHCPIRACKVFWFSAILPRADFRRGACSRRRSSSPS